jgi:hypothetical protein
MHDAPKPGQLSIFRWETLKEIDPFVLRFNPPLPGKRFEVELTSGRKVRVWRADDGKQYFCHGLTFGGKEAPGGPISPFTGSSVETILEFHYEPPKRKRKRAIFSSGRGLPPKPPRTRPS